MPLTPNDVLNKTFSRAMRGYDINEVDAFLDEVEAELARLLTENSALAAAPRQAAPVAAAPDAPAATTANAEESQQAALRTLLMAQRTADQAIEEARVEADKLLAEARARSVQVEHEVNARTMAALAELDEQRKQLEARIEDLRAFEREYRLRLKAYLETQLKDLDTRGGGPADAGGAGVPAAARTAAVGQITHGVADAAVARPTPAPAQAPPAAPPVAPPAPAVPPPVRLPEPEGFPQVNAETQPQDEHELASDEPDVAATGFAPPSGAPSGPPREAPPAAGLGPFSPAPAPIQLAPDRRDEPDRPSGSDDRQ